MFERLKFGVLGFLATALCAPPADAYTTTRKFHPGHYTVILPAHNSLQKYSDDAIRPGVVGIMKRFTWRELEPQRGVYDFSQNPDRAQLGPRLRYAARRHDRRQDVRARAP